MPVAFVNTNFKPTIHMWSNVNGENEFKKKMMKNERKA